MISILIPNFSDTSIPSQVNPFDLSINKLAKPPKPISQALPLKFFFNLISLPASLK